MAGAGITKIPAPLSIRKVGGKTEAEYYLGGYACPCHAIPMIKEHRIKVVHDESCPIGRLKKRLTCPGSDSSTASDASGADTDVG